MYKKSYQRRLRGRALASLLLAAALLAGCAHAKPVVHTGALPAAPPPIAPHVIDDDALARQIQALPPRPPAREIAFGVTEDQLPLGLKAGDLELGAAASGTLLGAVIFALALGWVMRLVAGTRAQPARAAGAPVSNPPGRTMTSAAVRMPATPSAPAAPPAPVTPAPQRMIATIGLAAPAALEAALVAPPAAAALPPVATAAAPPAPALPPGPSMAARAALGLRSSASGLGRVLSRAGGACVAGERTVMRCAARASTATWRFVVHASRRVAHGTMAGGQHLARWTATGARAAWRFIAYVPRQAWDNHRRRRSPFREGGEFWVHGAEMLRMGGQNEAERHYWAGLYECQHRGWEIEGAECLRRLARIAAQRGHIDEALRHLERAGAIFEERREVIRLAQVRTEVQQLGGPVHA